MNQDEADRVRRDRIEKRAYEIYEARGGQYGFEEEDWYRAEREVDALPLEDDLLPEADEEEAAAEPAEGI